MWLSKKAGSTLEMRDTSMPMVSSVSPGAVRRSINRGGGLISDFQVEGGGLSSLPARTHPLQCRTHLAIFILIVTERERRYTRSHTISHVREGGAFNAASEFIFHA